MEENQEALKICIKCEQGKQINLFPKGRGECRECTNAYLREYKKQYRKQERVRQKEAEYKQNNKQHRIEWTKEYQSRPEVQERRRKQRQTLEHKLKKQKYNKSDRAKEKNRQIHQKKKQDANYRIKRSISRGIYRSIKDMKKNRTWESLVGYNISELIVHLESKFKNGMSWDNYGTYWHIDHIKPVSWFVIETVESDAFKQCWALDNLQPLEASANMSKGNRFIG